MMSLILVALSLNAYGEDQMTMSEEFISASYSLDDVMSFLSGKSANERILNPNAGSTVLSKSDVFLRFHISLTRYDHKTQLREWRPYP